jgi:hypothetical protein
MIEADEAYQAVIETCLRLTGCRAEAISDLDLALPKLESLEVLAGLGGMVHSLVATASSSSLATVAFMSVVATTAAIVTPIENTIA